ncbi:hypothetical protein HRE01_05180 [Enterococcus faecalis]|nr:hypothetical protein [Enterococcus faecalis]
MNILPLLSQRRKSGAYKMIIWFIFFFIVSQIIIEKGQLPTVVYQFGLLKTLVFTAVCITLSMIIGGFLNQPVLLVGSTTILCSSVIAWKFRNKFENSGV